MTRYEIAMLKAGPEMDAIVHEVVGHRENKLGWTSPTRPYTTNSNWAKIVQLCLTENYGPGTLLMQDIYIPEKKAVRSSRLVCDGTSDWQEVEIKARAARHEYSGAWVPNPELLTRKPHEDGFPWVMADTEEMVLCRLLLITHFKV